MVPLPSRVNSSCSSAPLLAALEDEQLVMKGCDAKMQGEIGAHSAQVARPEERLAKVGASGPSSSSEPSAWTADKLVFGRFYEFEVRESQGVDYPEALALVKGFQAALGHLGVSPTRLEVAELLQNYAQTRFSEWWARIGRLKSMEQWRAKLRTLAAGGVVLPNLATVEAVGIYVFRFLRTDGTLNVDPLQAAP